MRISSAGFSGARGGREAGSFIAVPALVRVGPARRGGGRGEGEAADAGLNGKKKIRPTGC